MRSDLRRLGPLTATVALALCAAWLASEPGRAAYLANVLRQAHHLPGRYAV